MRCQPRKRTSGEGREPPARRRRLPFACGPEAISLGQRKIMTQQNLQHQNLGENTFLGKRIVIVGGGSSGWSPKLLADLMLTPSLADSTYILHDLNVANAERILHFGRKLGQELGSPATIESEPDPEKAFAGADFVLITISTGGLDAMAHDLAIPEEYGIYHTVGDTVGPGGWARTLRNVPIFTDLAQRVNRLAPNAIILNYSNPMAQLTKTLALATDRPVVGLCHGLFDDLHFLQAFFDLSSEAEVTCTYGGINHFFWITSFSIRGEDGYPLLRENLNGRSLPEILAQRDAQSRPGWYVADELYRFTGMLTYMADRHTSEFFPHLITSPQNLERYHLKRTTIEERRANMRRSATAVEEMTSGEIKPTYKARSRETAADIINSFVTGSSFIDVGNVPNRGQVANLPLGAVVETPVLVTSSGFQPVTVGPLPEPARSWVERHIWTQELTVEAALAGDLQLAIRALALDPLVSHLTLEEITTMGKRLLKANAQYLPQFQGI
jgi:alpha-galactosidase/6-phospho-beta-glucosidase family protein